MEIKLKIIVIVFSVLFTGLTAGLCFTWGNSITPGIGKLDDLTFLKSFQSMNRVIINPSFLFVFFMPTVLLFINAYLHRSADPATFWLFLIAGLLYFFGIGLVTVFKNVPLNDLLESSVLERLSELELKELRTTFEQPWNRWHLVRTITSISSFVLLVLGLINNK